MKEQGVERSERPEPQPVPALEHLLAEASANRELKYPWAQA